MKFKLGVIKNYFKIVCCQCKMFVKKILKNFLNFHCTNIFKRNIPQIDSTSKEWSGLAVYLQFSSNICLPTHTHTQSTYKYIHVYIH